MSVNPQLILIQSNSHKSDLIMLVTLTRTVRHEGTLIPRPVNMYENENLLMAPYSEAWTSVCLFYSRINPKIGRRFALPVHQNNVWVHQSEVHEQYWDCSKWSPLQQCRDHVSVTQVEHWYRPVSFSRDIFKHIHQRFDDWPFWHKSCSSLLSVPLWKAQTECVWTHKLPGWKGSLTRWWRGKSVPILGSGWESKRSGSREPVHLCI